MLVLMRAKRCVYAFVACVSKVFIESLPYRASAFTDVKGLALGAQRTINPVDGVFEVALPCKPCTACVAAPASTWAGRRTEG